MPTKDDPRITFRLDRPTHEKLLAEAERLKVKPSEYVRQALNWTIDMGLGRPRGKAVGINEEPKVAPVPAPTFQPTTSTPLGPAKRYRCPMKGCPQTKDKPGLCKTHGRPLI